LEIFLLHSFVVTAGRSLFVKLGINVYMSILCNLLISLIITILVGFIAKRLGIHDLIFKPYYWLTNMHRKRMVK